MLRGLTSTILFALFLIATLPAVAFCDFSIFRLIDYQQRTAWRQQRGQQSVLGALSNGETVFHWTGSHVVSASDIGIYARLDLDGTGSNKTTTCIALVRFDKEEAWLIRPDIGRFSWITFSDIRKYLKKQARNRNKDWGTGWVDDTKSASRRFREPAILIDSLLGDSSAAAASVRQDAATDSLYPTALTFAYAEDPEDDSLKIKMEWAIRSGRPPLLDTLRKYREKLETRLLLQSDSGILVHLPLDTLYHDVIKPLLLMLQADSLGQSILINGAAYDCHFIDRGDSDKVAGIRRYRETGSTHEAINLVSFDFKDVPNEKFKLPKHIKRFVQRDLDIERILAMILL